MAEEDPSHGQGVGLPWIRPWAQHGHRHGLPGFIPPHNSPLKSCCPAPRTERRVLVSTGLCHGLPSLVLY